MIAVSIAGAVLLRGGEVPREELAFLDLAALLLGAIGSCGFLAFEAALLVPVDLLSELAVARVGLLTVLDCLMLDVVALGGVFAVESSLGCLVPGLLAAGYEQIEQPVSEAPVFSGEIPLKMTLLVALHLLQRVKLAAPLAAAALELLLLETTEFFAALEVVVHGER